jgi:hypothetical protein
MPQTRRQLSLFVPEADAAGLEAARRALDPVQSRLIPAHVTLCREDELAQVSERDLLARLEPAGLAPITLTFGAPEPFAGHGILLNGTAGEAEYHALRERLLGTGARRAHPHITLAHPRNPRAPGNSLERAARLLPGLRLTFSTVALIEQDEARPWRVLRSFALGA